MAAHPTLVLVELVVVVAEVALLHRVKTEQLILAAVVALVTLIQARTEVAVLVALALLLFAIQSDASLENHRTDNKPSQRR